MVSNPSLVCPVSSAFQPTCPPVHQPDSVVMNGSIDFIPSFQTRLGFNNWLAASFLSHNDAILNWFLKVNLHVPYRAAKLVCITFHFSTFHQIDAHVIVCYIYRSPSQQVRGSAGQCNIGHSFRLSIHKLKMRAKTCHYYKFVKQHFKASC